MTNSLSLILLNSASFNTESAPGNIEQWPEDRNKTHLRNDVQAPPASRVSQFFAEVRMCNVNGQHQKKSHNLNAKGE